MRKARATNIQRRQWATERQEKLVELREKLTTEGKIEGKKGFVTYRQFQTWKKDGLIPKELEI
jgi:hypothetical protein